MGHLPGLCERDLCYATVYPYIALLMGYNKLCNLNPVTNAVSQMHQRPTAWKLSNLLLLNLSFLGQNQILLEMVDSNRVNAGLWSHSPIKKNSYFSLFSYSSVLTLLYLGPLSLACHF